MLPSDLPRIISNTSPLQYLHAIGHLVLLEQLYREVIVPQAVVDELDIGRLQGFDVPDCRAYSWMRIESVAVPEMLALVTNLGRDEAEVLALALSLPAELVILDDAFARQIAASQNIRYTGTLGVLIQAKRRQLIPAAMPLVDAMQQAGFRLSASARAAVRKLADE